MSRPTKMQLSLLLAPVCLALMLYAGGAWAQVDLSGNWRPAEQGFAQLIATGPPPGDFLGIPLNREGRALAAQEGAIAAGRLDELGHQCQPWLTTFRAEGIFPAEIRPIGDRKNGNQILAWHVAGVVDVPAMTIWVGGRKPPSPLALHTWGGVAIGHWQGYTLAVSITNIVDGWLTHNFAPESDQATADVFLTREGNLLTMLYIIHDPVYLSAPFIRARTYRLSQLSPTYENPTVNECLPAELLSNLSRYRAAPLSFKPLNDFMMRHYGIPPQVALGGAQQMYPEFQKTLEKDYRRPGGYCTELCCLPGANTRKAPGTCPKPAPASGITESFGER